MDVFDPITSEKKIQTKGERDEMLILIRLVQMKGLALSKENGDEIAKLYCRNLIRVLKAGF